MKGRRGGYRPQGNRFALVEVRSAVLAGRAAGRVTAQAGRVADHGQAAVRARRSHDRQGHLLGRIHVAQLRIRRRADAVGVFAESLMAGVEEISTEGPSLPLLPPSEAPPPAPPD